MLDGHGERLPSRAFFQDRLDVLAAFAKNLDAH
jgi:hypothetical protein